MDEQQPDYSKYPENVRIQVARDNLENVINVLAQSFGLSVNQVALLIEAELAHLRNTQLSLAAAQAINPDGGEDANS